jgi:hypothetical protein
MCAQRMLRSATSSDIVASAPLPREDERQCVFDLSPPSASETETPDQIIHRLAYALADFRSKLASESEAEGDPDRQVYGATKGSVERADAVARLAGEFAQHLAGIKHIPASREVDEFDAHSVNSLIAMIAEGADALITALCTDAESRGLQASGDWMEIPLVECREFEVVRPDPTAEEADDIQDRKLNS